MKRREYTRIEYREEKRKKEIKKEKGILISTFAILAKPSTTLLKRSIASISQS